MSRKNVLKMILVGISASLVMFSLSGCDNLIFSVIDDATNVAGNSSSESSQIEAAQSSSDPLVSSDSSDVSSSSEALNSNDSNSNNTANNGTQGNANTYANYGDSNANVNVSNIFSAIKAYIESSGSLDNVRSLISSDLNLQKSSVIASISNSDQSLVNLVNSYLDLALQDLMIEIQEEKVEFLYKRKAAMNYAQYQSEKSKLEASEHSIDYSKEQKEHELERYLRTNYPNVNNEIFENLIDRYYDFYDDYYDYD